MQHGVDSINVSSGITFGRQGASANEDIYQIPKEQLVFSPYVRLYIGDSYVNLEYKAALSLATSIFRAAEASALDMGFTAFMLDAMGMDLEQAENVMTALYDRRRVYVEAFMGEEGERDAQAVSE